MVRARVERARVRQADRGHLNRGLSRDDLDALPWDAAALRIVERAMEKFHLTARGWDRVRRVARTIADLDDAEVTSVDHMTEALSLRSTM